jgi:hypothetical protein
MNFGPIEFADFLRRKDDARAGEPAVVAAARAAAPATLPLDARLTVISTIRRLTPISYDGRTAAPDSVEESEL